MTHPESADFGLSYRVDGPTNGPSILFSNSLGTTLHMWDPLLPYLAQDYRVIRYDTRGHGNSVRTDGPYTVDALADDVLALLDVLRIETVHFCGLSLGGATGQALAVKAPERLLSLTLANTASLFPTREMWDARISSALEHGMASISDAVLQRWFTDAFAREDPDLFATMRKMFQEIDPRGYAACCAAVRDVNLQDQVARIRTPTLVICGDDDVATPPSASEFLADHIDGAHLVRIKNAAHISSVEQPQHFYAALHHFMTNLR